MSFCLNSTFFLFLEQFERAVEDLESALELALRIYESNDRRIAEAYFKCGCVLSYSNKKDKAIECLEQAVQILRSRVIELEQSNQADMNLELYELKDLIPDIESKVRK